MTKHAALWGKKTKRENDGVINRTGSSTILGSLAIYVGERQLNTSSGYEKWVCEVELGQVGGI